MVAMVKIYQLNPKGPHSLIGIIAYKKHQGTKDDSPSTLSPTVVFFSGDCKR